MLAAACSPRVPAGEFHIEGRIAGLPDSTVVLIFQYDGNYGRSIATDTLIGGRFSFVLPMTEKTLLSVSGSYDDDRFPNALRYIYAVPGEKITITGEGTLYGTWKIKSRVPEQREADAFMMASRDEYIRRQLLALEDNQARKITDPATRRATRDSLGALEEEINFAITRNDIALMGRTPVSDIWLDELKGIATMIGAYENWGIFREDAVALYERLTPEQRELPVAQAILFNLFPPEKVGVGDAMADATLKALDGSMHQLSDYAGNGKYLILDFWGSGCGPCIMSMPELKALGEKYPETLKVIGINLDTSEEGWRKGTEAFKPSYLNLNAPPSSDIDERYGVNGIPHFVIVSPEGVILDSWAGYGEGIIERKLAPYTDML